jgi:acetyl-CoA synthetase
LPIKSGRGSLDMSKPSYQDAYDTFNLEAAMAALSGFSQGELNACYECCDRHAEQEPDRAALNYESADGEVRTLTFGELRDLSAKFANVLVSQGILAGDCVSTLLPRSPELVVVILGAWRAGAVYQPLFTAFGPRAIEQRLGKSMAKLVVVDERNRAKLNGASNELAIMSVAASIEASAGTDLDFWKELAGQPPQFAPVMLDPDAPMLLMSTSGTTGPPKSVQVPVKALAAFIAYMRDAVDLRPDDRFWNMGDPGWAYGLYYGIVGPLALGHSTLLYGGSFTAENAIGVIHRHKITNLAGSPTAFRLIMASGPEAVQPIAGQLRAVSSAGEPLNPEVIRWFREHLNVAVHDQYGQTELGMVVANHHHLEHPVHSGSAGVPCPGYRVVVLDEEDRELGVGEPGIMAIDCANSPLLWFGGYREASPAENRYYRTGDTVEWNPDGSISFLGRSDDVITSSGYRIGPFDVESALVEHPAVVESAAIGKPDAERTEIVKAFVVLKRGVEPSLALAESIKQHVKARLSAHAYPREIEFVQELPKTPSGKIQRFILRSQETASAPAAPHEATN